MFLTLTNFKAFMGFVSDGELHELLKMKMFEGVKANSIREFLGELLKLPKEAAVKLV